MSSLGVVFQNGGLPAFGRGPFTGIAPDGGGGDFGIAPKVPRTEKDDNGIISQINRLAKPASRLGAVGQRAL